MNVETIADELGGWRFGPGFVCHCPATDEHLPGEGQSLRLRERAGRIFVQCGSAHFDTPDKVIAAFQARWPGLVVVAATGGDLLNCDDDPPRPLDDDFHAELLALCHETDERIGKIGLLYYTSLRADAQTLVEELYDYQPVSFEDATTVANEYLTTRDAEPLDVDAEPEEPTAEEIAAQAADWRARGLVTIREAITRWSLEHPDKPITIDDLSDEDRMNLDVTYCFPIAETPEGVPVEIYAAARDALPPTATSEEIFVAAQTLRSRQKPPGSAKAR